MTDQCMDGQTNNYMDLLSLKMYCSLNKTYVVIIYITIYVFSLSISHK
jgi:hypothetical protein